jgi:hypothetical protein
MEPMASYERDYQLKLAVISVIPQDRIKAPIMPVMDYVREADNLHERCQADKAELMAGGVDWVLVEDLPVRSGAFYNAYCNYESVTKLRENGQIAKSYLDSFLPVVRKAYRDNSYLYAKLEHIAGYRHNNEARALIDLFNLVMDYPNGLGKTLDMDEWFDKADYLKLEHDHLTKRVGGESQRQAIRKIRDQAFTHLKEAVDEVCACAREIFAGDEERLKDYGARCFTMGFVQ